MQQMRWTLPSSCDRSSALQMLVLLSTACTSVAVLISYIRHLHECRCSDAVIENSANTSGTTIVMVILELLYTHLLYVTSSNLKGVVGSLYNRHRSIPWAHTVAISVLACYCSTVAHILRDSVTST
jgi:hypothetical protein